MPASSIRGAVGNLLAGMPSAPASTPVAAPTPAPVSNIGGAVGKLLGGMGTTPAVAKSSPQATPSPAPAPITAPLFGAQPKVNTAQPFQSNPILSKIGNSISSAPDDSTTGIVRNTITGLPAAAVSVAKGMTQGYTNPSDTEQQIEQADTLPNPKNPVLSALSAPARYAGRIVSAAALRTFEPLFESYGTDVGQSIAAGQEAPLVKSGQLPASALDSLDVLHKTTGQMAGDILQTALGAGLALEGGSEDSQVIQTFKSGIKTAAGKGAGAGLAFGFAQALSSGSKDPLTLAQIAAQNVAAGAVLGAVTSGLFKAPPEIKQRASDVMDIINRNGLNKDPAIQAAISKQRMESAQDLPVNKVPDTIFPKSENVKLTKDPSQMDPTLRQEIRDNVQQHGIVATHGALQDELGMTKLQADQHIREAPVPQNADEELQIHNNAMRQVLLKGPEEKALLNEPPKATALLPEGKTGGPIEGKGFTATDKADPVKIAQMKAITDYRAARDSFNKNPTPRTLTRVRNARAAMDEAITPGRSQMEKDGGFTVSTHGEDVPEKGYFYAPDKSTETKLAPENATRENYRAFIEKNKAALDKENMFLGGWKDENGAHVLDVSTHTHNPQEAVRGALQADQDAIYSKHEGKSYYRNPAEGQSSYEDLARNGKDTGENNRSNPRRNGGANERKGNAAPELASKVKENDEAPRSDNQSPREKPADRPVDESGQRVTKAANDINEALVKKGLDQLPEDLQSKYTSGSYKDSVAKVTDMMGKDIESVKTMAKTGEGIPEGVHPQILFNAMEAYATKNADVGLLRDLAASPLGTKLSEAGGELGSHGFNDNPNSAISKIREVSKAREEGFSKMNQGKKAADEVKSTAAELKSVRQASAPKIKDWNTFVKSLQC